MIWCICLVDLHLITAIIIYSWYSLSYFLQTLLLVYFLSLLVLCRLCHFDTIVLAYKVKFSVSFAQFVSAHVLISYFVTGHLIYFFWLIQRLPHGVKNLDLCPFPAFHKIDMFYKIIPGTLQSYNYIRLFKMSLKFNKMLNPGPYFTF